PWRRPGGRGRRLGRPAAQHRPCSASPPGGRPAGTSRALARRLSCAALGVAPTARTGTRVRALMVVAGVVLAMSCGQGREVLYPADNGGVQASIWDVILFGSPLLDLGD